MLELTANESQAHHTSDRHVEPHQFGFVMEQTLGHVTHYRNLRAAIDADHSVLARWYPLPFAPCGAMETLPVFRRNWSARASLRARRIVAREEALQQHHAIFFHTQVTTLLSARVMRRVPSVISLDATPLNYDAIGGAYGHQRGARPLEYLKHRVHLRPLHAARALVTWSEWAKRSLVDDYGIGVDRITVVPPGVDLSAWPTGCGGRVRDEREPLRLLFVGADFTRKGGDILLQAFSELRDRYGCELHLVTKTPLSPAPGVVVYADLAPNSDRLRHLYATADLFVLPTLADCFPLVVQEAMAAGLPVVASDVGAIGEAVRENETGLLIPPGDVRALRDALARILQDSSHRQAMGARGRAVAEQRFDCVANARAIVRLMRVVAACDRGRRNEFLHRSPRPCRPPA